MISNVITIGEQVLVLFILIALGFLLTKVKLISQTGVETITNIVLYAVTPCVIVNAFQREFDQSMLIDLLFAFLIAFCVLLFSVFLAELLYKKKDINKSVTLKFALVFSNCGFMALPMQEAILGKDGVFFGSAFVAMFNMFVWSYGLAIMSGRKSIKQIPKVILNPGVIGTVIAVLLYVFKLSLPTVIAQPVSFMASLNTPLPMIIVGYYLASADLKSAFKDKDCYIAVIFRLVIIPLFSLFILRLFNLNDTLVVSMIIAISTPVAVITTMMSTKYKRDTALSVSMVTVSHILSLITLPLITALAQTIL